jgi:hypothetical protein
MRLGLGVRRFSYGFGRTSDAVQHVKDCAASLVIIEVKRSVEDLETKEFATQTRGRGGALPSVNSIKFGDSPCANQLGRVHVIGLNVID